MEIGFKKYLLQFQGLTEKHCAPVFFRTEKGERRNGTMTFVNTGREVLGVTAGHVADRLLECCDEKPGYGCQVGGAELDVAGRFIARHPQLDLATFRLSEVFTSTAGDKHCPISAEIWPPPSPRIGEKALFSGYPGIYRKERKEPYEFDVTFTHFGVSVQNINGPEFGMNLGISEAESLTGDRLPPGVDLGGISGGGVFRVIEDGLIARLQILGIVIGGWAPYELVLAHPLTSINDDGTFLEDF